MTIDSQGEHGGALARLKRAERSFRLWRRRMRVYIRLAVGMAWWLVRDLVSRRPGIRAVVVYLTPGNDVVGGGILSIASQWKEAKRLLEDDEGSVKVFACTMPTGPHIPRYTRFENDMKLHRLLDVLCSYRHSASLILHIPEYYVERCLWYLKTCRHMLTSYGSLNFNIMLQNIQLCPSAESIADLKKLGSVTITTAHARYGTQETANRLGAPVFHIGTWTSPEFFNRTGRAEKRAVLLVSPDSHQMKPRVLERIRKEFSDLEITIIENMDYPIAKKLFETSKWSLTFGEGLDGYFIEPILCGGVSFAVYNEEFFTEDFKDLPTVYADYQSLFENITDDMRRLDNDAGYAKVNDQSHTICAKYYNYDLYKDRIRRYYGALGVI